MKKFLLLFFFSFMAVLAASPVLSGLDVFFQKKYYAKLKGKNIGLITNQTGINKEGKSAIKLFLENAKEYSVKALFAPEHGLTGEILAGRAIQSKQEKLPIYSLYGSTRKPTDDMVKDIDVLIFDIQDIGSRSYTYISTLFLAMEKAAEKNIRFIVLDRPNPLGGNLVDGLMLENSCKSFIGYINVPYCHGMTIGEIAHFFNEEYKIGCPLEVVSMQGWKRHMTFAKTHLIWIPPSPHIPEAETTFFYPMTGILGELKIVSIGIGYTLPFKVIGAPWMDAEAFAMKLNQQNLKGVKFLPFHFCPQYGLYAKKTCHGVLIHITDKKQIHPVKVQYLLLGILKSMYPKYFLEKLEGSTTSLKMFCQASGSSEILHLLKKENYVTWKLIEKCQQQSREFLPKRKKYLQPAYD